MKRLSGWFVVLAVAHWSIDAAGQGMMPSPGAGGGGMGSRQSQPDRPAGPAEAAPEDQVIEAELPALPPWPGAEQKRLQFFELKGYFRFRADMLHNFNLGQTDVATGGATTYAPFWTRISERSDQQRCAARQSVAVVGTGADRGIDEDGCPDKTLAGANIRLRLEPTINVSETVRVHSQIDVLDNLVMGSTPDTLMVGERPSAAAIGFFSESQAAPVAGSNSDRAAILVKRAWGEVDTPLGQLSFGRMPWHWGMGLLGNNGACWDCNFGDNQDRIMFVSSEIAGHRLGVGYDFAASGPHSLSVLAGRGSYNGRYVLESQAIDLEQLDDVDQLFFLVSRIDAPETVQERLERGDVVLNYGAYVLWRRQAFDFAPSNEKDGGVNPVGTLDRTEEQLAEQLLERHAWTWTSDLWIKLLWKKLSVELEAVIVGGRVEDVSEQVTDSPQRRDILQYGLVARSRYLLFGDRLKLDLEIGTASGDDSELYDLNRRRNVLVDPSPPDGSPADTALDEFRFDSDYHVDLILFREIMGTVANATYFKPSVQFDLLGSLGARFDMIYSIANRPVAYPGNSRNLGLEMDLDLYYNNVDDGFYAGLQYGLLIPFGGLDRPGGANGIYGNNGQNAGIAQTLQARLIIAF